MELDPRKYPIGGFEPIREPSAAERSGFIDQIPTIATHVRGLLRQLPEAEQETRYRPGGWTIRQVVHHMADNDMNAYIRLKRALTESQPAASSYREDSWAELPDYGAVPAEFSLTLLEALHLRLHALLSRLDAERFGRTFATAALGEITIDTAVQRFVWHNRHHTAQIEAAVRAAKGGGTP